MPGADQSKSVTFRLGGALLERLEQLAAEQGVSRGDLARRFVMATMQDEDRLRVLQEVEGVRQELARLRADVAASLEMILLNVGDASPDEVRAWISSNLRR